MAAQATSSRGCKIASGSGSGYTDILSPGQTPFLIISVILMAIGLYWLIKYSFVDAYIRRRTDYALTNKRAIIMKGLFARREQSINLRLGQEIFVGQKKNDVGTISFGRTPTSPIMDLLVRRRYTPLSRPPQFVMIPDAGYVYDLILHAQKCG